MLEKWIIRNLKQYGNCVISKEKATKKLNGILSDLERRGIRCELEVIDDTFDYVNGIATNKKNKEKTYILKVVSN